MRRNAARLLAALAIPASVAAAFASARGAAPPEPSLFGDLAWRSIGPFRGGRVCAVAGVPGSPNVFYFGAVGGGVWKTENAGVTWKPIFDATGVASIGALAVAPSNPNVLYAGTGEADMRSDIGFGAGVFRSDDAGKTWRPAGLAATKHIGALLVDPRDANVILVAALGHAYAGNPERGVYRSTDGGMNWTRTLFTDENTGAVALAFAPDDPRIVFAALWQTRRPAWNAYPPADGPGGGLWRSDDGGVRWRRLSGGGLPAEIGRAGLATVKRGSGFRIWAHLDAKEPGEKGVYRSDDGGATWERVGTDARLAPRGWYFSHLVADPKDPETVWEPHVALYRSRDGARTFAVVRGAPGGDDYHALWIDPGDPRRMIVGADQGASVSVDGGATWSTWNNQPTGQFYHVATDGAFPYRVYGAQQDSGTASVASRGRYGQITLRDWEPIGAEESGMIAPDPRDSDVVYGGGPGGAVFRFSRTTAQSEDVTPWPLPAWGLEPAEERYRFTWTSPLVFSSHDPETLFLGSHKLLRTRDRGKTWEEASPDLTLPPASVADPGRGRGVIYAIAPSSVRRGRIWVGTDNGRIHVTDDDAKTWRDVTPSALTPWSKIGVLDASPHDADTVYAAVDRHRLDDDAPHVYRTHDGGRTWTEIVRGMAAPSFVNAVREDPLRKGLLYAATETGVFVSFDDGGLWRRLQANLPPASVRDLVVHGDDLVIATHGRGFWILDGGAPPLREIAADTDASKPRLFTPATATRVRGDVANDTPQPPEEPVAANPPDGAILDYYLATPAAEVALEIRDPSGAVLRRLSSRSATAAPAEPVAIADLWLRRPSPLSTVAGHHRVVWDLREESPPVLERSHGIAATVFAGAPELPRGALVPPGTYRVVLTADGRTFEKPLAIAPDPRVKVSAEDLAAQRELLHRIHAALGETTKTVREMESLEKGMEGMRDVGLKNELARLKGSEYATTRDGGGLKRLDGELAALANAVDRADAAPTQAQRAVFEELRSRLDTRLAEWRRLRPPAR